MLTESQESLVKLWEDATSSSIDELGKTIELISATPLPWHFEELLEKEFPKEDERPQFHFNEAMQRLKSHYDNYVYKGPATNYKTVTDVFQSALSSFDKMESRPTESYITFLILCPFILFSFFQLQQYENLSKFIKLFENYCTIDNKIPRMEAIPHEIKTKALIHTHYWKFMIVVRAYHEAATIEKEKIFESAFTNCKNLHSLIHHYRRLVNQPDSPLAPLELKTATIMKNLEEAHRLTGRSSSSASSSSTSSSMGSSASSSMSSSSPTSSSSSYSAGASSSSSTSKDNEQRIAQQSDAKRQRQGAGQIRFILLPPPSPRETTQCPSIAMADDENVTRGPSRR